MKRSNTFWNLILILSVIIIAFLNLDLAFGIYIILTVVGYIVLVWALISYKITDVTGKIFFEKTLKCFWAWLTPAGIIICLILLLMSAYKNLIIPFNNWLDKTA